MRHGSKAAYGLLDRLAYNAWWAAEHLVTERRLNGRARRVRASMRRRMDRVLDRDRFGRVDPVERRSNIAPTEFIERYFRRSRPVVLAGLAASWAAVEQWSLPWLAEHYGRDSVCITDYGDPDFIPLSDAVGRIERGETGFARFGGLLHDHPELLGDLALGDLCRFMPRWSRRTSLQFFVAASGAVSPLHADGTCNFHVQVGGEKVWRIIEPRFNPAMKPLALGAPHFKSPLEPFRVAEGSGVGPAVDVLEACLYPGDVLFNPSFFWHEVRYRSPSISVGVRWVSPTSFLRGSPMMASLMLLAQNPSVVDALVKARGGRVEGFYR